MTCTCIKIALELQPEDWVTLQYYGEVLGKLGRTESAIEVFKRAVDAEDANTKPATVTV